MKKILLLAAAVCCMFTMGSCKSKSSAYKTAYEQAKANDRNWDDDDSEVLTTEQVSYESVRPENVKVLQGENASALKMYSVVIGVYGVRTNAYAMKERMEKEGYRPIIAENDFGQLRVIVSSFDDRAEAIRARDAFRRKHSPGFDDAWILMRNR